MHGVYQVTQSAFESCDLEEGILQDWSRGTTGGIVSIVLETSQTTYFIDSVPGQCQNGMKLSVSLVQRRRWCILTIQCIIFPPWQVQYGNEHVIEWGLGHTYDDVMIPSGTSLLFQWPSGTRHNVVELRSVPSMGPCDFTSSDSGQVKLS